MANAVTETVLFNVTASFVEAADHWVAITIETGVSGIGTTRQEAQAACANANVMLIRSWKRRGHAALADFMSRHGIAYTLRDEKHERAAGRGAVGNLAITA